MNLRLPLSTTIGKRAPAAAGSAPASRANRSEGSDGGSEGCLPLDGRLGTHSGAAAADATPPPRVATVCSRGRRVVSPWASNSS